MRYPIIPIIVTLLVIVAGYFYMQDNLQGKGVGLYAKLWEPNPVHQYWSPDDFYQSTKAVVGEFDGPQCVSCHSALTPGIVMDWRGSQHAQQENKVYCNACHGRDHQALTMPTPRVCKGCHQQQHDQFQDEKRYGFPSHALAMERAVDAKHFVDKPKAEVASCIQCHSVATKCDSCHTRHRFSAAEARRPEACITCHSGPPHPDDETYYASAHGKRYLAEGDQIDWSKPLKKGNYEIPTCAYCHMHNGKHQVADKAIWKFGLREVNPHTSKNKAMRARWVKVCSDCHAPDWAASRLAELDKERKTAWKKLYSAENLLKDLRSDDLLMPSAKQRPNYPTDLMGEIFPYERIGFFEGQASAFYNVSRIERKYFDMWYFHNLGAYKGAAHGATSWVLKQHRAMDLDLKWLEREGNTLRSLSQQEADAGLKMPEIKSIWTQGEYTNMNKEQN